MGIAFAALSKSTWSSSVDSEVEADGVLVAAGCI